MSRTTVSRRDVRASTFHGMVTVSDEMRRFFRLLERVAQTNASVLIRGETGTGKELVARALHRLGPRGSRRFCPINCATLTPELLASELFGHVRGAFTGAIQDHRGLFKQADGGTVFLDEVAEIDLELQARLLRVLQERTFVPLGGTDPETVDVRILSASNKALRAQVEMGLFREDLMYRIRVVPLFVPALRERAGDIEALSWHMVDVFNQLGPRRVELFEEQAMAALLAYRWPGNVRELRNVIEHAFSVGEGPVIALDEFPPELRGELPPTGSQSASHGASLEREQILEALRQTRGRKALAAQQLQMSRSTLWRKMRELGI